MVDSWYEHKRKAHVEVPYSFQCEHCGRNSGSMRAVISAEAIATTRLSKTLDERRDNKLRMEAQEKLVSELKNVYKGIVEKKIYPKEFHDECPFCHQPQSWAVSGLQKEMFQWPIGWLGACSIFGLFALLAYFLEDNPSDKESSVLAIAFFFGLGVILAAGSLIWNIMKIIIKKSKTSSGVRNLPLIEWESFRDLLNEQ